MRVLLQNWETRHYFYGGDRWGPHAEQALDFEKGERADHFKRDAKVCNVRIVFKFEPEENRPDVYFPLSVPKFEPDSSQQAQP